MFTCQQHTQGRLGGIHLASKSTADQVHVHRGARFSPCPEPAWEFG